MNDSMRKHLVIVGLILALEGWLGIGLFGGGVGIVCSIVFVILAIAEKQRRSQYFRQAAIYVLLFIATITLLGSNARLAMRRATPVISAVNRYHSEHGQYPRTLNDIVPAYLPSIPHAGFTWISREFRYYNQRPQLYFAGMFHGVFAYDFPTESWRTNESGGNRVSEASRHNTTQYSRPAHLPILMSLPHHAFSENAYWREIAISLFSRWKLHQKWC